MSKKMQINWYFLFYIALKTHCVEDEWWCDEIIYAAFAFLHLFFYKSWKVFDILLWSSCTKKGWCVIFFFRYCYERKHETNDNAAEDVFLVQPIKLTLKPFFVLKKSANKEKYFDCFFFSNRRCLNEEAGR